MNTITASQDHYTLRVNANKVLEPSIHTNGIKQVELYGLKSENYVYEPDTTHPDTTHPINTITATGRTAKIMEPYKEKDGHLKVYLEEFENANNVATVNTKTLKTITTTAHHGTTEKVLEPLLYPDLVVIAWLERLWNVRILTEMECGLLMGFTRVLMLRAMKVATRKMIYHVCGNSIAVPCVEDLFINLFSTTNLVKGA